MAVPAFHMNRQNTPPLPFFGDEKFFTFDDMLDEGKDDALGGMLGCIVFDNPEEMPRENEIPDEVAGLFMLEDPMEARQLEDLTVGRQKRETWEDYVLSQEEKAWR
ncbi:hypothetical protein HDU93_004785, partial [Gonapodya sp. JEL0774]